MENECKCSCNLKLIESCHLIGIIDDICIYVLFFAYIGYGYSSYTKVMVNQQTH